MGNLGRARARRHLAGDADVGASLLQHPPLTAAALARACRRFGIRVLGASDPAFPPQLKVIPDPPLAIFLQGDPAALCRPAVALVGARRASPMGRDVAAELAAGMAGAGITVVSGLARGIDTAALRAAADRAPSVAVLGSGLANPYPRSNRGLARAIVDGGGALVSEYPPEAGPRRHHFPERNRLISGLALGVVVVEAGERSGSLITARLALEQGREVLAVPGPVTSPLCRGCHRLLRDGAALVECAADISAALGLPAAGVAAKDPDGAEQPLLARVLAAVAATATSLDEVIMRCGIPGELASAALVELELGGFVRQVPGGYIRRPSR